MEKTLKVIERIFRAKTLRRSELAKLPFKKKIEVLVKLQKMTQGIKTKGRKGEGIVWQIEGKEQE